MKGALGDMLRKAQEMQQQLQEAQSELQNLEVIGESGAGMVKVTINGAHESKRVEIDPTLMGDDKELLEDLIAAAINDATHKLKQETESRMQGVAGGMELPPGFKMPF